MGLINLYQKWKNKKAIKNFISSYAHDEILIGDTATQKINTLETLNNLLVTENNQLKKELRRLYNNAKSVANTLQNDFDNIKNDR